MAAVDASDAQMQWWEDLYNFQLQEEPAREPGALEEPRAPLPDEIQITDENWREHLQITRQAYPAYRDFFDARVAELGRRCML